MSLPYSPNNKNDDFLNLMAEYFGVIIKDLTGTPPQLAFGDPISPLNLIQIHSNYSVAPFFGYVNTARFKTQGCPIKNSCLFGII
jgi:hypothetical protein